MLKDTHTPVNSSPFTAVAKGLRQRLVCNIHRNGTEWSLPPGSTSGEQNWHLIKTKSSLSGLQWSLARLLDWFLEQGSRTLLRTLKYDLSYGTPANCIRLYTRGIGLPTPAPSGSFIHTQISNPLKSARSDPQKRPSKLPAPYIIFSRAQHR